MFPFIIFAGVLYLIFIIVKAKQFFGNEKAYYYEIIKKDPYHYTPAFTFILGLAMALGLIFYSSSNINIPAGINGLQLVWPVVLFSIPFYFAFKLLYFMIEELVTKNMRNTIYKKGIKIERKNKEFKYCFELFR